jgi:hypothetical protein
LVSCRVFLSSWLNHITAVDLIDFFHLRFNSQSSSSSTHSLYMAQPLQMFTFKLH